MSEKMINLLGALQGTYRNLARALESGQELVGEHEVLGELLTVVRECITALDHTTGAPDGLRESFANLEADAIELARRMGPLPSSIDEELADLEASLAEEDYAEGVTLGDPPDADTAEMEEAADPTHNFGYYHSACGGLAFLLDHMPHPMSKVTPEGILTVEGVPVKKSDIIKCGHCGLVMGPLQTRHVRELGT